MKLAIIGYGKLGKAIETIALQRGHSIQTKVTKENATTYQLQGCDVAIECTNPEAVLGNISRCISDNIPIVVGSTGWYASFEKVQLEVLANNGSLLYATNFSIGVHLFWEANKVLANIMRTHDDYEVSLTEIHHTAKKDAPSGTAITTAELLIASLETKKRWELAHEIELLHDDTLRIKAVREGDAKGTHRVTYESKVDRIMLTHEAFSRDGFAMGAVLAAEFLQNKKGLYSMGDVIKNMQ